jgi:putative phosphoribosyl transferase
VIAISPGGVRVASEIARAYDAPLDVVAGLRLEVPGRPHSIFGAVADGAAILVPERVRELQLPEAYVNGLVEITQREVNRITRDWRSGTPPLRLEGRTVVLVDDGLSEGVMVAAAANALRQAGVRRLIYAAPMASQELFAALSEYCDERLLLHPADAHDTALVCDPQLEQTTRSDVGSMIRRSRSGSVAVAEV